MYHNHMKVNTLFVLQVFRVYSNNQEFESIRLGETLSFLEDGKVQNINYDTCGIVIFSTVFIHLKIE